MRNRIVEAVAAAEALADAIRLSVALGHYGEGAAPVEPILEALLIEASRAPLEVTPADGAIRVASASGTFEVQTPRLGGGYVVRTLCARIAMRFAVESGDEPPLHGGRVVLRARDGTEIGIETSNQQRTGYWIRMSARAQSRRA